MKPSNGPAEHQDAADAVVAGPNALAQFMDMPEYRGPIQAVLAHNQDGKLGENPARLLPAVDMANHS